MSATFSKVRLVREEASSRSLCHGLGRMVNNLTKPKRRLLGLLFTAASQTLLQFGRHNLGGQLGGIMVLHTWDQLLNVHFHVHCLVPGGALADAGTRWMPTHPAFLFPVKAL